MVKNPDYKAFFKALADSWCYSYPRQTVSYYTASEAHAMPWLRTNLPIMQSEEFYEAYGISKGDGMYLPPEERVLVW
jgi:putative endopeptidase